MPKEKNVSATQIPELRDVAQLSGTFTSRKATEHVLSGKNSQRHPARITFVHAQVAHLKLFSIIPETQIPSTYFLHEQI